MTRERLVTTLIFAALAHGLILLGIGFVTLIPSSTTNQPVAVTVVNTAALRAPTRTDYLAQANQIGPGNDAHRVDAEGILKSSARVEPNAGIPMAQRLRARAPSLLGSNDPTIWWHENYAGSQQVVTSLRGKRTVFMGTRQVSGSHARLIVARLIATGNMKTAAPRATVMLPRLFGKHPVASATTTNTRAVLYATYLNAWRQRIEAIGSAHFQSLVPKGVKQGHLTVEVTLKANGELASVHLTHRSRYPQLNAAALRIIRLASPYSPFPKVLRRKTRRLTFSYRWTFLRRQGSDSLGIGD